LNAAKGVKFHAVGRADETRQFPSPGDQSTWLGECFAFEGRRARSKRTRRASAGLREDQQRRFPADRGGVQSLDRLGIRRDECVGQRELDPRDPPRTGASNLSR
jgi:hypothetical protein